MRLPPNLACEGCSSSSKSSSESKRLRRRPLPPSCWFVIDAYGAAVALRAKSTVVQHAAKHFGWPRAVHMGRTSAAIDEQHKRQYAESVSLNK